MPDHEWLKNLAQSRYTRSGWRFSNPSEVKNLVQQRTQLALRILYDEALDATLIYNSYAPESRKISVLPIQNPQSGNISGIVILLIDFQLKIVRRADCLEFVTFSPYANKARDKTIKKLIPCYDTFGSVLWQILNDQTTIHHEDVIKMAMKDLIEFADQNQEAT